MRRANPGTATRARGLIETSGPTVLQVAAVADGEGVKRVGNTLAGFTIPGAGVSDHTGLSNLPWTSSGHTGTASRLFGSNGAGAAAYYQIGVDVQAYDAGLASLIGSDNAAGLPYVTGVNTWATATLGDLAVSGGAWTVTDLTIASEARGDLLMRGAASWGRLAPGTSGLPLVSAGAGADLTYAVLGVAGGGTASTTIGGARDTLRVVPYSPATNYSSLMARGSSVSSILISYSAAGNVADGADATGPAVRYGNSTSGSISGIAIGSGGTLRVLQTRWVYTVRCTWRTDSVFTTVRLWIGITANSGITVDASDTPNAGATFREMICLRGSTVAGDTNWQLYTASTTAGTATDTGVSIDVDTEYEAVFLITATSASVSISKAGGAFSTPTVYSGANVPTSSTDMLFLCNVVPQAAVARYIYMRGMCAYPTP